MLELSAGIYMKSPKICTHLPHHFLDSQKTLGWKRRSLVQSTADSRTNFRASGPCLGKLWRCPGIMALVPVLTHTLGKSPIGNSFIAIRVYCLLSCHSLPFCRVLLCILSSSPLGIWIQQLDPPLSFLLFKLNKLIFVCLSSYAICTRSLTIWVEGYLWVI